MYRQKCCITNNKNKDNNPNNVVFACEDQSWMACVSTADIFTHHLRLLKDGDQQAHTESYL